MTMAMLAFFISPALGEEAVRGSPADYMESISAPAEGGGASADAAEAEVSRVKAGKAVPAVSTGRIRKLEEIVVTARKRSELLENTPISITVLSETALRDANVQRTEQLAELIPNLIFTSARSTSGARARIRGLGTTSGEAAFDPGVGTYVDGVYLPRGGKILDVLDIAQVEVLRGPQGTLFGKNTVGGAINFTTVKPGDEFEASAFVRAGSFESVRTRAMLNLPIDIGWLEDRLAMRLAFASANSQGFVENLEQKNYQSGINSLTFLGSLRFTPHERVTVDVSGSWDRTQSHTRGRTCAWQSDESALGWIYDGFKEACQRSKPYEIRTESPTNDYQESFGAWGTITGDVGDIGPFTDLTVKSITSWRKQTNDHWTSQDIDVTEVLVTQLQSAPGQPGFLQMQEEVQLNGRAWDDRIDFVTGVFSFWDKGGDVGGDGGGIVVNGLGYKAIGQNSIDNFTWAFFAQATARLAEWASLTAGLRYTEDTKRVTIANQALSPEQLDRIHDDPSAVPAIFAEEGTLFDSGEKTFAKWTPMASLATFAPEPWLDAVHLDHLMGYFTYSQGFRGGGFNAVIDPLQEDLLSFGPESIENFELGVKTVAFEERLTFNLSLFHMNFTDIQLLQNVVIDNPDDPENPYVRRITTNAAKARSQGLEAELMAVPIEGLQITANIGVLDAEYTEYIDATGNDRSGERFGAPKFTSFVAVQYSLPITMGSPGGFDGWLTPRLQWSYTADRYFGFVGNPTALQRGYNKLDVRVSYDFLDDRAQIAFWGINITDKEYMAFAEDLVGVFGITTQGWARPASFGVEVSYSF